MHTKLITVISAFSLGFPCVNRPDLLRLAVNSIRPLWHGAFILDNSADGEVERVADQWPVEVKWFCGISLTFSQSMNYLFNEAWCRESEVCFFMHNDAEAEPGTAEKLLAAVEELIASGRKWCVAFTNYDTLAAFNMQAVEEVGAWDTNLPQYFSDNDYYRRLRLAGYETVETGLPVRHHNNASSTIKSDPERLFLNSVTYPLHERYYAAKWGGVPGQERFGTPFNRHLSMRAAPG